MNLLKKYERIIKYFFFSVLSTILDTCVVWLTFSIFQIDLVIANTLGVVSGFFVSYFLSMKSVFDTKKNFSSLFIYIITSLIGLLIANGLISITYTETITYFPKWFSFICSKGVSIVVPFFIMYFMRKYLYLYINKRKDK